MKPQETGYEGHLGQPSCEGTRGILSVGRDGRIYALWDTDVLWLVVRGWLVCGCYVASGTFVVG